MPAVPFTASCMARFLKWNRKMSARKAHTVLSLWEKPRYGMALALCAVKSGNIRQKWYARPRPAIPSTRRTTISHRRTGAPGADEKCPYPLLAEATAPQAIPQAGKGGCKAERGCGWENCHSHRTPDCPGSGICQKSSRRCCDCGALCVTPVCYAVLFLYHAYAGERRGWCIRGQHLSL